MLALPLQPAQADVASLDTVVVTAPKQTDNTSASTSEIAAHRSATSDSAQLLQDIPGVSLYGAGGVSSLPVVHGLADDRLRVQVNGMDLMSACPNHMNSPLSYIAPTNVESVKVYAGVTPVSVGGDSIGGTIQVKSSGPEFATEEQGSLRKGSLGGFYRSNGHARGGNLAATYATEALNLTYTGSMAKSDNYWAGADFKAAGPGTTGGPWLSGKEVGSTAYDSKNHNLALAFKHDSHLLQFDIGQQRVGFEGFPNQRMDMTGNDSTQTSLRYTGQYDWGELEARTYYQNTHHEMNMGPDRFSYGSLGMPMLTKAETTGFTVQGNLIWSERDLLRTGVEYQNYTLYDWWPQAGGSMGPNTFWNVDFGERSHLDLFGEWEAMWNAEWRTLLGLRAATVKTDSGPVHGYNATPMWAADAATFNAQDRQRSDRNWDLTASAHYTPDALQDFEVGYSRKARSPNLYQRYPWSTQPMATLMNNFVGDGNGYVGNLDLKPEVAHTLSATGNWHAVDDAPWSARATAYYTYINDYMDAQRCDFGQCGGTSNVNASTGFVNLQYANQSAQLYGLDLSGQRQLWHHASYGNFNATGLLNYVRGSNLSTGDDLYNIMPLNAKLAMEHNTGAWHNTAEMQLVAAKTHVSQVRNEISTPGYALFNLRSYYNWPQVRLDFGIENVFNRYYASPLGGAYVGQGASMGINNIPWNVAVPGMGRSINTALTVRF